MLNHCDANIEKHLLIAIEDPYFEVRSQVCARRSALCSAPGRESEIWIAAMLSCLKDKSFEVAAEAAKALGEIGDRSRYSWKCCSA